MFKQLSISYALQFVGMWLSKTVSDLEGNNYGRLESNKGLKELAALSGGLKAHVTYICIEGQETCRKCCGGNGYLMNSGIARDVTDKVWYVTAEGDYTIMLLFSAKYILK